MNFPGSEHPLNPNYGYNPMMDPQMKHAFPMNNSIKKDNGHSSSFNDAGHSHPMQTGFPPTYAQMDPNQQAKMAQQQGSEGKLHFKRLMLNKIFNSLSCVRTRCELLP